MVIVWIVIGQHSIVTPFTLYLQYLGIIGLVYAVTQLYHWIKTPITSVIRFWYPLALLEFFYVSTTLLDGVIFPDAYTIINGEVYIGGGLDWFFQGIDAMIFGYQPAIVWGTKYNSFVVQELFHFAYFSYYFLIFGIPCYVYVKKQKSEYIRVLFNLLFVFVMCYILYIILPVVGGRMLPGAMEITETYRHGLFTHIMVYVYKSAPHWGAAFPSSHVAVSLTLLLISFRYFRSLSALITIVFILLCISTVYCHYHYFVDVIAGFIYGFVMYGISEIIYTFWGLKEKEVIDV